MSDQEFKGTIEIFSRLTPIEAARAYEQLQQRIAQLEAEKQQLEADCGVQSEALKDLYWVCRTNNGSGQLSFMQREIIGAGKALALNSGKSLLEKVERMKRVIETRLQLMRDTEGRDCYCDNDCDDGICWGCLAKQALTPTKEQA